MRARAVVVAGLVGLLVVGGLAAPRSAAADDKKRADQLYEEARAAFAAADYARACPLFTQYYTLEPTPAGLFTIAECEARWGKPARALAHFEEFLRHGSEAEDTPAQRQRVRMATEQTAKLSQVVGRLLPVRASGVNGSVSVKIDDVPVAVPAERPVVVEPGEHVVDVTTELGTHEQRRVVVGAGETRTIEVGGAGVSAAPAPTTPAPAPAPAPAKAPANGEAAPSRITTPVLVAGGVGVAGVVVGTVAGGLALGARSDVDAHCVSFTCDHTGKEAADRGQTLATVSTIAFAVGAAGIAAAVVLYLIEPSSARAGRGGPRVGLSGIGGSF